MFDGAVHGRPNRRPCRDSRWRRSDVSRWPRRRRRPRRDRPPRRRRPGGCHGRSRWTARTSRCCGGERCRRRRASYRRGRRRRRRRRPRWTSIVVLCSVETAGASDVMMKVIDPTTTATEPRTAQDHHTLRRRRRSLRSGGGDHWFAIAPAGPCAPAGAGRGWRTPSAAGRASRSESPDADDEVASGNSLASPVPRAARQPRHDVRPSQCCSRPVLGTQRRCRPTAWSGSREPPL